MEISKTNKNLKRPFTSVLTKKFYNIVIEFCTNCETHISSTRHDPNKYLKKAEQLKEAFLKEFATIKVDLKPLNTQSKFEQKRLGLFEIHLENSFNEHFLIFSKLKTMMWPDTATVLNNVRKHMNGITLNVKFDFLEDTKSLNTPNLFSNAKCILVSEIDNKLVQIKVDKENRVNSAINLKPRNISAMVLNKINKGIEKSNVIYDLLENKYFFSEKKLDENLEVEFINVKPGRYMLMVLDGIGLKSVNKELIVDINSSQSKEINVNIEQNDKSFLEIELFQTSNMKLEILIAGENNYVLNLISNKILKNGQIKNLYQIKDIAKGKYKLIIKCNENEIIKENIELINGFNRISKEISIENLIYDQNELELNNESDDYKELPLKEVKQENIVNKEKLDDFEPEFDENITEERFVGK